MARIIDFAAEVARRSAALPPIEGFDTLECMYCDAPTRPSSIGPGPVAFYRCTAPGCRRLFRIVEDGTACRGARGRAF